MRKLHHFRFWCQKVLPLVYDDSLSYYEVLCKVVDYINALIKDNNEMIDEIDQLKEDLTVVQKWITDYDTSFAESVIKEWMEKNLASMVFFGLSNDGHFVAYIPENWSHINFATTGLEYCDPCCKEYGHLVLCY